MKKLLLSVIAVAAVAMAAGKSYNVKLYSTAMVGTTELKPGEYKIEVNDQTAVIKSGKKVLKETAVKVENVDEKYPSTTVRLGTGEKPQIQEIRLAGAKTKLVFAGSGSASGI